jgi:mannose-6-phosphate isomerase-like protein (cupin superfamily)
MKTLPIKFVPKGWGFERIIVNNNLYCGKQLFIAKGKKFSVHFHQKKTETFFVTRNRAIIRYKQLPFEYNWSDPQFIEFWKEYAQEELTEGDVFHVPVGLIHQVEAITDFVMFEFSTFHKDEDSFRILRGD